MCNHMSTEQVLMQLNWPMRNEYQIARRYIWSIPSRKTPSGFVQSGGGLTYALVTESGHMVPMDVCSFSYF